MNYDTIIIMVFPQQKFKPIQRGDAIIILSLLCMRLKWYVKLRLWKSVTICGMWVFKSNML